MFNPVKHSWIRRDKKSQRRRGKQKVDSEFFLRKTENIIWKSTKISTTGFSRIQDSRFNDWIFALVLSLSNAQYTFCGDIPDIRGRLEFSAGEHNIRNIKLADPWNVALHVIISDYTILRPHIFDNNASRPPWPVFCSSGCVNCVMKPSLSPENDAKWHPFDNHHIVSQNRVAKLEKNMYRITYGLYRIPNTKYRIPNTANTEWLVTELLPYT